MCAAYYGVEDALQAEQPSDQQCGVAQGLHGMV